MTVCQPWALLKFFIAFLSKFFPGGLNQKPHMKHHIKLNFDFNKIFYYQSASLFHQRFLDVITFMIFFFSVFELGSGTRYTFTKNCVTLTGIEVNSFGKKSNPKIVLISLRQIALGWHLVR